MNVIAVVASASALLFSLAGAAHAGTMFAGPLFPNGVIDSCVCQIVNVTSSPKTIEIEMLNKGGGVIIGSGPKTLAAGQGDALNGLGGGFQYCKFSNVTAAGFRATMGCFFNGTIVDDMPVIGNFVAVPAR